MKCHFGDFWLFRKIKIKCVNMKLINFFVNQISKMIEKSGKTVNQYENL